MSPAASALGTFIFNALLIRGALYLRNEKPFAMDFNIITLEIADLLIHFDYYDRLVSETGPNEEQTRIRDKSKEHLAEFFADARFYNNSRQLLPLAEMQGPIKAKLQGMKVKDIHALVEKLEKDVKKMRKLYKSLRQERSV